MDIFFTDPDQVPLPPDEVRIIKFEAQFWPDGNRVRVNLEITPFQHRPSGEISITNQNGDELASVSIVETMTPQMEFTLHLRGGERVGPYHAKTVLFYRDAPDEENPEQTYLGTPQIVDSATQIIAPPRTE